MLCNMLLNIHEKAIAIHYSFYQKNLEKANNMS